MEWGEKTTILRSDCFQLLLLYLLYPWKRMHPKANVLGTKFMWTLEWPRDTNLEVSLGGLLKTSILCFHLALNFFSTN